VFPHTFLLGMIHRTGKRALHTASPILTANGNEENGRRQSTSEPNTEVKGFVVLDIVIMRYVLGLLTLHGGY
jgi:hypothetical protein